jgi:hypothetical protein
MPYRMTTLDTGTTLNKTETYDGFVNASDLWHFRQVPCHSDQCVGSVYAGLARIR